MTIMWLYAVSLLGCVIAAALYIAHQRRAHAHEQAIIAPGGETRSSTGNECSPWLMRSRWTR